MPKETGFANFRPNQAKAFIREQHKIQPQNTFIGQQRLEQRQSITNKHS